MHKLKLYAELVRLNRPIGILLLLWPTLWGLWLAAGKTPVGLNLWVFVLGTVLMRSAGCAVNDYADRHFDLHVKRTAQRPVTSGRVSPKEALLVAGVLALLAALLVLLLSPLVWLLAIPAAFLAVSYPFMKRFFAIPQAYLGICFGFGIPMAYAATVSSVPPVAWTLLLANVFWTIAYDTEYAMVDREDDLKIGIRTSAITFGRHDVLAVMLCYASSLGLLAWVAYQEGLSLAFWPAWCAAVGIAAYHYTLIRHREPDQCFKAFLHNNWLGGAVFAGFVLGV
jgi:4-hydroxybenzoate polyprenyltransferase